MIHSHEDEEDRHPYWYGRIIGVCHALVRHIGPTSRSTEVRRMDFLWVRWFGRDLGYQSGWTAKRLHRLGFMDATDIGSFGFLNPDDVIRAVHLIPGFNFGRTSNLLGPSIARPASEMDEDWTYYYVDSYVSLLSFLEAEPTSCPGLSIVTCS
jgi:hypothetical protein